MRSNNREDLYGSDNNVDAIAEEAIEHDHIDDLMEDDVYEHFHFVYDENLGEEEKELLKSSIVIGDALNNPRWKKPYGR